MSSEFSFINKIRNQVNQRTSKAILGIGDDTAILRENAARERLITTDLLIEDVHFKLAYTSFFALGHKTLAVSLSDIAAMGGTPEFALLSLGIPKSQIGNPAWEDFFAGYFSLAEKFDVTLIGGDTSSSPDKLVIDSIVIGNAVAGQAIRRSTAKIGDAIYVTGNLGASAAGLQLLLSGERFDSTLNDAKNIAMRTHLMPEPRVAFGQKIGSSNLAHAMMDVSDGLAQDLKHICEESNVNAMLDFTAVPVASCISAFVENPETTFSLAISGGEDYELLFTASHASESELRNFAADCGTTITRVGEIVARKNLSREPRVFLRRDERVDLLTVKGYDHFLI